MMRALGGMYYGALDAEREVEAFLSEMDRGLSGSPSSLRSSRGLPIAPHPTRDVDRGWHAGRSSLPV